MNETYVTIKGRLTADPTVRTTRTGAPMTTFRIAHSARRQVQGQPGQWEDTEASFYDVVETDPQAEWEAEQQDNRQNLERNQTQNWKNN